MEVRTERSEVRTKTTEGQYSPVRLELARLVSSLLYGTRAMLVLNFPAFKNKKYTAYDRFHGNGPYGKIPTKKEPITTLGFALPYNKFGYLSLDVTCSSKLAVFLELRSRKKRRAFENTREIQKTQAAGECFLHFLGKKKVFW